MAEEKENGEKEKTLLDYAINLSPEAALIAGLTEEQQKALISRAARKFGKVYPRSYNSWAQSKPLDEAMVYEALDAEKNRRDIYNAISNLDESVQDSWLLSNAPEGLDARLYDNDGTWGEAKGTFFRPSSSAIYLEPDKEYNPRNAPVIIHEGGHKTLHDIAMARAGGVPFADKPYFADAAQRDHGFIQSLDSGVRKLAARNPWIDKSTGTWDYAGEVRTLVEKNFPTLDDVSKKLVMELIADEYGLSPSSNFQFATGHALGYREENAKRVGKSLNDDYRKEHAAQAGEGGAQLMAISSRPDARNSFIEASPEMRDAYQNLLMAIDDDPRDTPDSFKSIDPGEHDDFDPRKVVRIQNPYGGYDYAVPQNYKREAKRLGKKRIQYKNPYTGSYSDMIIDSEPEESFKERKYTKDDFGKVFEAYVDTPYGRKWFRNKYDAFDFVKLNGLPNKVFALQPMFKEDGNVKMEFDEFKFPLHYGEKFEYPEWYNNRVKGDYAIMKKIHTDRQKAVDFKKVLKKIKK